MNTDYNYIYDDDELEIIAIPQDQLYFINKRKFKSLNNLFDFLIDRL